MGKSFIIIDGLLAESLSNFLKWILIAWTNYGLKKKLGILHILLLGSFPNLFPLMLMKSLKYFLIILVSPASNEMYLLPEGFLGVFFFISSSEKKRRAQVSENEQKKINNI